MPEIIPSLSISSAEYITSKYRLNLSCTQAVAKARNVDPTQIALAYLLNRQYFQIIPIIGISTLSELKMSIEALDIELSQEEIDRIHCS